MDAERSYSAETQKSCFGESLWDGKHSVDRAWDGEGDLGLDDRRPGLCQS